MVDDSENVNRAVRLLREAADALAQTNINVDTSSSQSTSITTPNTRPSTNNRGELAARVLGLVKVVELKCSYEHFAALTSPHSPAAGSSRCSGSYSSNLIIMRQVPQTRLYVTFGYLLLALWK